METLRRSLFSVNAPPPPVACTACGKSGLCVWAASSEGLHLEQGEACNGSRVTLWAKHDWSPLPKKARQPPRPRRTTRAFSRTPSFPSLLPLSFTSFSFLLWKGAVIHNPLNYRQLNYPAGSPIFLPSDGHSKTINLFTAGDFSRGGAQW